MDVAIVPLVEVNCWCGIHFAVPKSLYDEANRTSEIGIHCPTGHTFIFNNTTVERLRKELAQTRDARDRVIRQRDAEQRAHAATKGQLTKARNRAAKGVCPCCHRSFAPTRMAEHMKTKHPDFKP
jgi:4-hydroxy-3-methylbut-2-enyl diphosphate reductase IspH